MTFAERLLLEAMMSGPGDISSGVPRPAWWADALCQEHPDVNFFPNRGETATEARRICQRCAVRPECLRHALENSEGDGVWGGYTGRELRRLARHQEASAA